MTEIKITGFDTTEISLAAKPLINHAPRPFNLIIECFYDLSGAYAGGKNSCPSDNPKDDEGFRYVIRQYIAKEMAEILDPVEKENSREITLHNSLTGDNKGVWRYSKIYK